MDYEGLSLADLEKLYTEQSKIYNDTGGTNLTLYDELVEMSKLIEEKKRKLKFGGIEQISKVRCEICNKIFENLPEVLKSHEEYHKTWVKFNPVKTRQLDQVGLGQNKAMEIEFDKADIPQINISEQETTTKTTEQKNPSTQINPDIVEELKKATKKEEEFLKELVSEIKKPTEKAIQVKQKMEEKIELPKPEKPKRNWFAKKPRPENSKKKQSFGFPRRRYKRPSFSLKGHFPIIEVLLGGGPIILMKNADRSIEVMRAKKIAGKFIETSTGIFEIDGEYEHRFNKVASFYVYNVHNSKPLSLSALESVQNYYKTNQTAIIVTELAKIKKTVEKEKDPLASMAEVFKDGNSIIDENTKKFLIEYLTFNKDDVKLLIQNRRKIKHPKLDQTRPISTYFPMLIIGSIAMTVVLVMRFFNPLKYFNISPEIFRLGFIMIGAN